MMMMIRVIVFGGTTEGRKLCEVCAEYEIPVRYCVATTDGARQVGDLPNVIVNVGRLSTGEMLSLIRQDSPALVIDATHPYAEEASRNISAACRNSGIPLLRVTRESIEWESAEKESAERESAEKQSCICFTGIDDLLAWLELQQGNIFVTTGASYAETFAKLPDFQRRIWLRILPNMESLRVCLDLGYRPERLICMQGPFSEELNSAMFKAANAKILVTKNSGAAGGFPEKVRAAGSLGMLTALLRKPDEPGGVSLEDARLKIMELQI